MPGKKPVPKLLNLCETFASRCVRKFLRRHSPSTCKYCTNNSEVSEDCHDLVTLKAELSGLPTCLRKSINKNVILSAIFTDNPFEYIYFLTVLFEDKKLGIFYDSKGETKDLQFFSRFGRNVTQFYSKLPHANAEVLTKNFTLATNLRSVSINDLTETILEVIGKCCSRLTSITGKLMSPTNLAFRKLVFEDPETQLQRNKCCDTLESLEIYIEYRYREEFAEQVGILLHNVPNLKQIPYQNMLNDIINALKTENQASLKLTSVLARTLTMNMIQTVKTYFPDLSRISLLSALPLNILQALSTVNSITYLSLGSETATSDIYNGLLHSVWNNLQTLEIHGDSGALDLSLFAEKLPNLTRLGITRCSGVTCNGRMYFKYLGDTSLSVTANTGFSGIRSFSKNVVYLIALNFPSIENAPVIPELLNEVFPRLRYLSVSRSSAYKFDTILDILKNCPKLESFTCLLGGKTNAEYRQIEDYLKENNIDCIVK